MNLGEVGYYLEKAGESMLKKDAAYTIARRNGLFKTNWTEGEINEVINAFKGKTSTLPDVMGGIKKVASIYGKIDDVFKLAKFREQIAKGADVATAIREAQKWGMDYSLAHPAIKRMRRSITPLISYYYKITPLLAETIAKRPWVIAKYAAIPTAMMMIAKQKFDFTEFFRHRNR